MKNAGFTLMEGLIAGVVMAILASAIIPQFVMKKVAANVNTIDKILTQSGEAIFLTMDTNSAASTAALVCPAPLLDISGVRGTMTQDSVGDTTLTFKFNNNVDYLEEGLESTSAKFKLKCGQNLVSNCWTAVNDYDVGTYGAECEYQLCKNASCSGTALIISDLWSGLKGP